ncbi:MAG: Choline-sulfatase, partial [Candidatus Hydrogenedentes bacterium]|nr:Choline-sulfatase [Candidatus Hydrogenedentota bacterium]
MSKMTRRQFLGATTKVLAAAPLAGALGSIPGCTFGLRPNILILMVDQMRTPPEGYGDDEGAVPD